jgi:hypothetical protein
VVQHAVREALGRDDFGHWGAQVIQERPIDEVLATQRRVEPRIKDGGKVSWLVAVGAVGVQIGTHPALKALTSIIDRYGPRIVADCRLGKAWREKAEVVQRAQLVV